MNVIRPILTPKRLAWLRRLEIGVASRKSRVGYDCMTLGWTEWNYVNKTKEHMTKAEAQQRYGEQYWEWVTIAGERLTSAGREILKEATETQNDYQI